MKEAHGKLEEAVESLKIIEKMEEFDARQEKKPLFKVFRHYMRMVMEMMTFVRAVRTGDWALPSRSPSSIHQVLFYARHVELRTHDPCKLGRDGQA